MRSFHVNKFALGSGKSGGSFSVQGSLDISSILRKIFHLPVVIPRTVFKTAGNVFWAAITLNFKIIRLPLTVVSKLASTALSAASHGIESIANVALRISDFNAEAVAGVIGRIRGKSHMDLVKQT